MFAEGIVATFPGRNEPRSGVKVNKVLTYNSVSSLGFTDIVDLKTLEPTRIYTETVEILCITARKLPHADKICRLQKSSTRAFF